MTKNVGQISLKFHMQISLLSFQNCWVIGIRTGKSPAFMKKEDILVRNGLFVVNAPYLTKQLAKN